MFIEKASQNCQRNHSHANRLRWVSPRVKPAHMVITLHPTIHDSCITLFPDAFPRYVLINPVGISPHGRVNFTKLHRGTRIICDCVLETLVEVSVIQKHVRVMVEAVEMSLDRLDG